MTALLLLLFFQDPYPVELCKQWNLLYEKIQYGTVDRKEKGKVLREIVKQIRSEVSIPQDSSFYFPIEGYDVSSVGGNGSGYIERAYNFLQGNAHRGHPAHDIFIHDSDQNCIDDNSGKPAYVIAMSDGIVLAAKTDWTQQDTLRGGNYLMLYNPNLDRYYYYAHNSSILVTVGEIVRAGTRIATVGRTGRNAFPKRSSTHLHLMVLKVTDDKGKPYNYYPELITAKTLPMAN